MIRALRKQLGQHVRVARDPRRHHVRIEQGGLGYSVDTSKFKDAAEVAAHARSKLPALTIVPAT